MKETALHGVKNADHKTKSVEVQIKAAEGEKPGIVAYAATFDRVPDSYGDVIAPGAFAETLKKWEESGKTIPLLYNHIFDDPFMNIGAVTSAKEDERGLLIEATFDEDNETAMQVHKLVKEGRLSKMSFAYDVLDWGGVTLEDGTKANELRRLDIYEVSVVLVPANDYADIVDAKAGRRNSKADEESLENVIENLEESIQVIRGLLAADNSEQDELMEPEPEGNGEEPDKANPEDQQAKARRDELIARIENFTK